MLLLRTAAAFGGVRATRPSVLNGAAVGLRHAACISCSAVKDTAAVVEESPEPIVLPTNDDSDRLLRIRHSSAHVMAMAVQKLFKGTKVSIGPWIEKVRCRRTTPAAATRYHPRRTHGLPRAPGCLAAALVAGFLLRL